MPATTDKVRELLGERLEELDDETGRVKRAIEALGSTNGRRPAPTRAKRRTSTTRRRRAGGTRRDDVIEIVEANPGIKVGEVAKKMKMNPNYLYRIFADLTKEGRLEKRGKTYRPGKLTLSG